VEAIGFSTSIRSDDEIHRRLVSAFDSFIDIYNQSDKEAALLARRHKVDIAVDLNGYTQGMRTGIFALRAAPLQVNFLGYPGTMGSDYIDYLIADPILIPKDHQNDYSEKIVYLPNSYQPNDTTRRIADRTFTRAELGLPLTGFVFCCFNNSIKITPEVFDCWMRVLKRVPKSVLWLLKDNEAVVENLRREASQRGVAAERLVFAERMALPEHLARHRLADLFLDTLPYNAHTTASDALWAGLPVLTQLGETFAGRVAASLLNAIGLPELVTLTEQAYEELAVELTTNSTKYKDLRSKLADNRLTTSLFDIERYVRHIEAAYAVMYDRHQADLAPDHIYIS
jgi:predicted O-linked N-acetylglucosamine transferase (SPINDLY family)